MKKTKNKKKSEIIDILYIYISICIFFARNGQTSASFSGKPELSASQDQECHAEGKNVTFM